MSAIYLDHAATTPLHPAVLDAMMPYLTDVFGNPSSVHAFGQKARQALTRSRDAIGEWLGVAPAELIFTGSGTESDNLALLGLARALKAKGKTRIVTSAIEHHAVLNAVRELGREGFEVTFLSPGRDGRIDAGEAARAIGPDTGLVSIMWVNNETGVIQPVEEIGQAARDAGAFMHVDAVQALGILPVRPSDMPVDLMSFSAHKIGGPKGIGLLYCRANVPLSPILHGGNQERKRRPGTENVAAAAGFAKAVELAVADLPGKRARMRKLRDRFLEALGEAAGADSFAVNGHPDPDMQVPSILNVSFPGTDRETVLFNLDLMGVAASAGAACAAGSLEDSHVLLAMGLAPGRAKSAIRFSFGTGTGEEEAVRAARIAGAIVRRLRGGTPDERSGTE
jgi:cysteine desulfurase